MINRLVLENLKHRRLRTTLSALSIGFQVTMILAVAGLSRGMLQDSMNRARGVGADIWIKPPGASAISLSGASMPQSVLRYFRGVPHVKLATGTALQPIGGISTIAGIDYDEFVAMSGPFRFLEGGPFQSDDDVIVDEYYASQQKLRAGDTVVILNHKWRVCGVVEPGKLSRLFVRLHRLQELTNSEGKLSQAFLKLDDPSRTREVVEYLKSQPELTGYSIYSIEEFLSLFSMSNVPGLRAFIYVIIGLSLIIGFLVVGLTMYTTVLERTREIGILKALGASPFDIIGILVRETVVLAVAGWAVGILLSLGAHWMINNQVRANLQSEIAPDWWPIALAVSLTASLLGAVYPGLRAARQDAIEALSYE
ncbi:MAG: ABC transporter permease [Bryobacteraceae bacterium]